jgi:pyridoxine 5'-phosphate synthase PdxJ
LPPPSGYKDPGARNQSEQVAADSSTLTMKEIRFSDTPVHTRSSRRHIQEDDIFRSYATEKPQVLHDDIHTRKRFETAATEF